MIYIISNVFFSHEILNNNKKIKVYKIHYTCIFMNKAQKIIKTCSGTGRLQITL
jgi:hypothetical protein